MKKSIGLVLIVLSIFVILSQISLAIVTTELVGVYSDPTDATTFGSYESIEKELLTEIGTTFEPELFDTSSSISTESTVSSTPSRPSGLETFDISGISTTTGGSSTTSSSSDTTTDPSPDAGEPTLTESTAVEVSSCYQSLTEDSILTADLECSNIAFFIETSGVSLDCQDHSITYAGSSSASYSAIQINGADNSEVKNCIIENYDYGISVTSSSDVSLTANRLFENRIGVYVSGEYGLAESGNIENNYFESNEYGIELYSDANSFSVSNNEFISNDISVYIHEAKYSILQENYLEDSQNAILLNLADETQVLSNTGKNLGNGIVLVSTNDGYFWDNSFNGSESEDSTGSGILFFNMFDGFSNNNDISDNNFNDFYRGITYSHDTSQYNEINDNRFCNSKDYDFYCAEIADVSSSDYGSGNFMDSIYSCDVTSSESTSTTTSTYTELSACDQTFTTDEEEIVLTGDLTCSSENGINLLADDLVLDCNGYSISSDSNNRFGIYVQGQDVQIRNCKVSGFSFGLYVYDPSEIGYNVDVENSKFQNNYMGIYAYKSKVQLVDSSANSNKIGVYTGTSSSSGAVIVSENSNYCNNDNFDIVCYGANSVTSTNDYFDTTEACSSFSLSPIGTCSEIPDEVVEETAAEVIGSFPNDYFTNTYSCSESDACYDGLDNDADGLIDCADSDCNLRSCDSDYPLYACVEGACIEYTLPEAEQATLQEGNVFEGWIWDYNDFFTWINSATVYHESGVCNNICSSYSKQCLFADAGRSLCSDENSEKCTCV